MEFNLITVKEVAQMLKCTPKHVYFMEKAGKFPAKVKIGGATRWVESEVKAWLENILAQRKQTMDAIACKTLMKRRLIWRFI